ncbi:MAG: hypothetical protein H6729_10820 [Deltaproteobacteria bacterium]|nr:hypothetical protein [Deltaproteobacteria bacterium]
MEPSKNALEIVVIGLGQAGGNIAAEWARRGYEVFALNTARTDLQALDSLEDEDDDAAIPMQRRIYIGIDDYDGAGSDPVYGGECIREHASVIRSAIVDEVQSADVVLIAAGLGGGTGSAVEALLSILEEDELPIVVLATLPSDAESALTKVNAVRAMSQILRRTLFGIIVVDNERLAKRFTHVSIASYFAHINAAVVGPLDELNRMNARPDLRSIRSFDGEDFRKLLLAGGLVVYGTYEISGELTSEGVIAAVRSALDRSELMPSGFEMARVSYLGLILEAHRATLDATPIAFLHEIEEQLKAETLGGAVHFGVYHRQTPGQTSFRVIAATQAIPGRLREFLNEARQEGVTLGHKVEEEVSALDVGDLEDLALFRTNTRPSERPHRRRSQRPSAQIPPSDAKPTPSPSPSPSPSRYRRRPSPQAPSAGPAHPQGPGQAPGPVGGRTKPEATVDEDESPEIRTDEIDVIARITGRTDP